MSATEYHQPKPIDYSAPIIKRAERSLICSPFQLQLFTTMAEERVPISEIAEMQGVKNQYTYKPMSELVVDNALVWLIQVGLVRREVDGQGITDSFRLTPLGKQIVKKIAWEKLPQPTWGDRVANFCTRWLRIPF